jgi:hypothetical protein
LIFPQAKSTLEEIKNLSSLSYCLKSMNHLSQADNDSELNPATIEHILPESSSESWKETLPSLIYENLLYRLRNSYSLGR